MAVTFTPARVATGGDFATGNRKSRVRDITCSGTYTTGGDTLSPSVFGLRVIEQFNLLSVPSDGTLGYDATYIYATNKLKFWETGSAGAGSAEKGSGESMASVTFRATAIGY